MPTKNLTDMNDGKTGRVVMVRGGHGLRARLDAIGIRPGVNITKVSGQLMHGPVIVRIGATQVAIGFGMARHITVEL
jgi:ferrous iron transport protein A